MMNGSSSANVTVKAKYEQELRRVVLTQLQLSDFGKFQQTVLGLFPAIGKCDTRFPSASLCIKYLDDEGDRVTVSSQAELQAALSLLDKEHPILRLEISSKQEQSRQQQAAAAQTHEQPKQTADALPFPLNMVFPKSNLQLPELLQLLSVVDYRALLKLILKSEYLTPLLRTLEAIQACSESVVPADLASALATNVTKAANAVYTEVAPVMHSTLEAIHPLIHDPVEREKFVREHVAAFLQLPFFREALPDLIEVINELTASAAQLVTPPSTCPAPTAPTEEEPSVANFGVKCRGCDKPIVGVCFKCKQCSDFNLCNTCEVKHEPGHTYMKIISPPAGPNCRWATRHGGVWFTVPPTSCPDLQTKSEARAQRKKKHAERKKERAQRKMERAVRRLEKITKREQPATEATAPLPIIPVPVAIPVPITIPAVAETSEPPTAPSTEVIEPLLEQKQQPEIVDSAVEQLNATLVGMGFINEEVNRVLLQLHECNLEAVIAELISEQ